MMERDTAQLVEKMGGEVDTNGKADVKEAIRKVQELKDAEN